MYNIQDDLPFFLKKNPICGKFLHINDRWIIGQRTASLIKHSLQTWAAQVENAAHHHSAGVCRERQRPHLQPALLHPAGGREQQLHTAHRQFINMDNGQLFALRSLDFEAVQAFPTATGMRYVWLGTLARMTSKFLKPILPDIQDHNTGTHSEENPTFFKSFGFILFSN